METLEEFKKLLQLEAEKEQELLAALMELEAKVNYAEQDVRKNTKEIKHIVQSKTWKYAAPLRKFSSPNQPAANLPKIEEMKEMLASIQKELVYLRLQIETKETAAVITKLKEAKKSGESIQYLDALIKQKQENDQYYQMLFKTITSLYKKEKNDYRNLIYSKLLAGLSLNEIPEMILRAGEGEESISLKQVSSFRASLSLRSRQRQLGESLPESVLDDKETAYSFIDSLGVRRPFTLKETFTAAEVSEKEGIVIKPVDGAGSRGVYLVRDLNNIIDIKRQETLKGFNLLKANMENDIAQGFVKKNAWFMEELITHHKEANAPANDIKFYCFYGSVALILEITRFPELKYCWWTPAGERIRTGKYDENLFKGEGTKQSEIDLANAISSEIPAPFIRVDFLRSKNGLVFGEFTPKPGNFEEFNRETDQLLGDYYLEAESRITKDLLQGKQFNNYNELIKKINTKKL